MDVGPSSLGLMSPAAGIGPPWLPLVLFFLLSLSLYPFRIFPYSLIALQQFLRCKWTRGMRQLHRRALRALGQQGWHQRRERDDENAKCILQAIGHWRTNTLP